MEFKKCIHHCVCIESDNCNPANCCEYKPESSYVNIVFSVDDVVYIVIDNEVVESVISTVSYSERGGHCDFAYTAEASIGKYMFSREDIDVTVFKDKESAQNHIDTNIVQNETVVENSVENVETVSDKTVESVESEVVSEEPVSIDSESITEDTLAVTDDTTIDDIESADEELELVEDDVEESESEKSEDDIVSTDDGDLEILATMVVEAPPKNDDVVSENEITDVSNHTDDSDNNSDITEVDNGNVSEDCDTNRESVTQDTAAEQQAAISADEPLIDTSAQAAVEHNVIVNKRVNTLSITFNMMKRANKPYLPVKYLRQSQSRLFNQIMTDSNLVGYEFALLISDEDIINLSKQYSDILAYDSTCDVIALKPECNLDTFISKYPIDAYIMNIVCKN